MAVKRIYEPRVIAGIEGALPVTEEISPEDQALLSSEIGTKVTACLKDQSGIRRPITLKDSLELDLAVDSLGRIELVSCLESAFDIRISDECVSRAFSVKDLILGVDDELKIAEGLSTWKQDDPATEGDYWKKHLRVLPNNESLNMLEFGTGYFAWLFRFVVTAIDCLIFRIFFQIKADGAEKVPTEGAYILFANHTSFLDGPVIAASLPQRPVFQIFYFVFGPYFFRPFMKWAMVRNFVKMARVIPFDFSTHFLEALRSCFYVLERGKGLCFFPEGLRSTTGELEDFKKGFGVLAKVTGAKLVPVAIHGAHEAWASTAKFPHCYPIRVTFGEPLLPADLEKEGMAMGAKNSYAAICIAARKALLALQDRS